MQTKRMLAVTDRPRRRRLEAFTTDCKIIRLIIRRVAIFPAAAAPAARQIFDGVDWSCTKYSDALLILSVPHGVRHGLKVPRVSA